MDFDYLDFYKTELQFFKYNASINVTRFVHLCVNKHFLVKITQVKITK